MKREHVRKLLGGYATGTLTPDEQQALFEAALNDQELFDALAGEEALRAYAAAAGGAYSRAGDAVQLREALARLGASTSLRRAHVDVSLSAALAGGSLMAVAFLAGLAAGRW